MTNPLSPESLLALAARHGLDLVEGSLRPDNTGWDFQVAHAITKDGVAWILRVPRRPDIAEGIDVEARLLDVVRGLLPVAVPDWRIRTRDLVAYPRLAGEPAATEAVATRTLSWRIDRVDPPDVYVEQLAEIMARLHQAPIDAAAATGIPVRTPAGVRLTFSTRLERARREIGMHDSWWNRGRRWLEDDRLWPARSVLLHGDLHPGHTLVDGTGSIVGLLDWTDAEVGDPGQEFIEATRKFEPKNLARVLDAYQRHGGDVWPGLRANIEEGVAFAPMFLGLLGLDSEQPHYVERARTALAAPSPR
ncbi:macrolide phosphotransferase [Parafrankia irregularis]|uniref:Macrolide phosphotransferase n=1 Tax=Parafrankia irregularis TaxID=795642 RepID=A0A0S4QXA7_9ACTN|nr:MULTISPECIES: macrolide 2'-phosphotransferase [Parafrankia]MBE3205808.1 macrolide 2'-phosphotransferase [Parafrankia sp. CH37]CUU59682.1 macrolide phosphotransferase [Parafrankia irregularis]